MGADLLDGDVELTEFEAIDVESIKGVGKGANGFPHLLMKGLADAADPEPEPEPVSPPVPDWHPQAVALVKAWLETPGASPSDLLKAIAPDGSVDEKPDIDGGMQAIALIGKLIGYEADELAAGHLDETCDIDLLNSAANCVKAWLSRERAGAMAATDEANMGGCGCCGMCTGLGCGCCPDCTSGMVANSLAEDELAKDSRTFSAAERKKHAAAGNALPDGSYPIPDADALRRAAILARSGHGDVKAARKLIGRRAKELGVANPLDEDDTDASASKGTLAEGEATVQDVTQNDQLSELVAAEVAKALKPHEERNESLGAELAKAQAAIARFEAMPRPGGPVMSVTRPLDGLAAKAPGLLDNPEYLRQMAATVTDPDTRKLYAQAARQAEKAITAP